MLHSFKEICKQRMMTTVSYLEIAKKGAVSQVQNVKVKAPFDTGQHFSKIMKIVNQHRDPTCNNSPTDNITTITVYFERCYSKLNDTVNDIVNLFLKDPTRTTVNMFYKTYPRSWQNAVSSNIVYLQSKKDYGFYEAMDNNTLLDVINYCIYNKEYRTFKTLFKKLKSGFYTIFYNIINTRDIYLMTIFSELSYKYYIKMLNTKNLYGNLPLDDTLIIQYLSSEIISYEIHDDSSISATITQEHIKPWDMQLFVYMTYSGASSELLYKSDNSSVNKKIFQAKLFEIYASQVADIMHKYLGYENDYKKLHNTDLVFNKILSYLV